MRKRVLTGVLILVVGLIFASTFVVSPGPNGEDVWRSIFPGGGGLFNVQLDFSGTSDTDLGYIVETKPSGCEFHDSGRWVTDFDFFNYKTGADGNIDIVGNDMMFHFMENDEFGFFSYLLLCSEGGNVVGSVTWPDKSVSEIGGAFEIDISCRSDSECDDFFECTRDICNLDTGKCEHTPNHGSCDDFNACDGVETCDPTDSGADLLGCVEGTPVFCDDLNECTADSCNSDNGQCEFNPTPEVSCDGGDGVCNFNGQCVECTGDWHCDDEIGCTDDICTADGDCDNQPTDPFGVCGPSETCNANADSGTGCVQSACAGCKDCDDWFTGCDYDECHNSCNIWEECYYKGVVLGDNCIGLTEACFDIFSCFDYSKEECVNDPCSVAPWGGNGCALEGGSCVEAEYCGDGVCGGDEDCLNCRNDCGCSGDTPFCSSSGQCVECTGNLQCDDGVDCTDDICSAGVCQRAFQHSFCSDDDVCNGIETCTQGGCVVGTPLVIDDGVDCTIDSCDSVKGVVHELDDGVCDNGLYCDGVESCTFGGCVDGTSVSCEDDLIGCTIPFCDEDNDVCAFNLAGCGCSDSVPCPDDGNVCTDVNCVDFNCETTFNSNVCDDGDACTTEDSCSGGECFGEAVEIDDGIVCTVDSCDPATGVSNDPDDGMCNDFKECTVDSCGLLGCDFDNLPSGTTCSNGVCDGAGNCVECVGVEQCEDGIDCTVDSCINNACARDYDDSNCDDGNVCNGAETCTDVGCRGGQGLICNDFIECTDDSCDSVLGCQFVPKIAGEGCSNGVCDGSTRCVECVGVEQCDDRIDCTEDICSGNVCSHFDTDPLGICADWQTCNANANPGTGCVAGECTQCDFCEQLFDCNYDVCHSECGVGGECYYKGDVAGDDCVSKNSVCGVSVGGCEDYSAKECEVDRCGVAPVGGNGCELRGGSCQDAEYCGDGVCNGGKDCGSCSNDCGCGGDTPECVGGVCVECAVAEDCDGGSECTTPLCQGGRCVYNENDDFCNDGNKCNGEETCSDTLGCVDGTPLIVTDWIDCTADSCDPDTGIVTHTPQDGECQDGLGCNGVEVCVGGVGCEAGKPMICDDGLDCTVDDCVEGIDLTDNAGACIVDDAGCDCERDSDCKGNNPCLDYSCNIDTRSCETTPNTNTCNDDNACTESDVCSEGVCSGNAVSVEDGIDCTVDSCDPILGVQNEPDDGRCGDAGECVAGMSGWAWTGQCVAGVGCGRELLPSEILCDGVDNDCDGLVDEDLKNTYYFDGDGDGFGNPVKSVLACTQPGDYVDNNLDCDDGDELINPNGKEVCDGEDNDCNFVIDDGDVCSEFVYYCDGDDDKFVSASPSGSCVGGGCIPGSCQAGRGNDCDDDNREIYPGAEERCNGEDDNCNGDVDEDVITRYYFDRDGDGFGDADITNWACERPDGYVLDSSDCDDNDITRFPGAEEVCDGDDEDCDTDVDEGFGQKTCGQGNCLHTINVCSEGQLQVCDAFEGATEEACGDGDEDCDGRIDEDLEPDECEKTCADGGWDWNPGRDVAPVFDSIGDDVSSPPVIDDDCENSDLDGDGDVDENDLRIFDRNYKKTGCGTDGCEGSDLDGDGDADLDDFKILSRNYGKTGCGTGSVSITGNVVRSTSDCNDGFCITNEYVQGDLDGGGTVTALDYALLNAYLLNGGNWGPSIVNHGLADKAADMDCNGVVDNVDLRLLRERVMDPEIFEPLCEETTVNNMPMPPSSVDPVLFNPSNCCGDDNLEGDPNKGNFEAVEESCDGIDNDCDGLIDEAEACQVGDCLITSVQWSKSSAQEGETVKMIIETNEWCDGEEVEFDIYEQDRSGGDKVDKEDDDDFVESVEHTISGSSASVDWIAKWQDDDNGRDRNPPEFYFKVSLKNTWFIQDLLDLLTGEGGKVIAYSDLMTVSQVNRRQKEITINFKKGRNFFSLPLIPEDNTIQSVFGSVLDDVALIATYQGQDWKFYTKGRGELNRLDATKGYILIAKDDFSITVSGYKEKNNFDIPRVVINPGWNLFSTYSNTVKLKRFFGDFKDVIILVRYKKGLFGRDSFGLLSENDDLEEDAAYWVYLNKDEAISISPVSGK